MGSRLENLPSVGKVGPMRKPACLNRGDRVLAVAPAGACDPRRLEQGLGLLEQWGLVVEGPPGGEPFRYMSAPDELRAGALYEAFSREDVAAVLVARGGFGCARLMPRLRLDLRRVKPRIFCGFSDATIMLARLVEEARLVCFHGPMAAVDLPRLSAEGRERFRRFLFDEEGWWDGRVRETWREGRAEGVLAGGCLSVLVTTLGTPYEVATEGRVLFLEDVAEQPYRIDRMLTQLRHAGKFDRAAALVFGPMTDCDGGEGSGLLRRIAMEAVEGLSCPVLFGLEAGHGSENVVLPMGCRVRVVAQDESPCLELAEPVFSR
jgi:muramoyltetrapeptide carboxypeptidase